MRNNLKKIFLLFTIMAAVCIFAGCVAVGQNEASVNGEKQESDTKEGQEEIEQSQPGKIPNRSEEVPADTSEDEISDTTSDGSAELYVHVESIGDNSVLGSRISVEPVADSSSVIMVSGGGDDEVLILIHFMDNTSYIYQIIRNGGADVETSEGSFSDIGLNMILDLTGHYEGDDFYADQVTISNVILN